MDLIASVLRWPPRALVASFLIASVAGLCVADKSTNSLSFIDANAGRVYAQAGPGVFAAIDTQSASKQWIFKDNNLRLFTKPVFISGAVFVAATRADSSRSELIRINASTGIPDWRVQFEGLGGNGTPVLCAGEVLVADYWRKTVSAFNMGTGKDDWTTGSLPFLFLFPPGVLDKNAFFVVAEKAKFGDKQQLLSVSFEMDA